MTIRIDENGPVTTITIALPVPPARVSLNWNCPFWLLVHVGQAETLISSLSFSPECS